VAGKVVAVTRMGRRLTMNCEVFVLASAEDMLNSYFMTRKLVTRTCTVSVRATCRDI